MIDTGDEVHSTGRELSLPIDPADPQDVAGLCQPGSSGAGPVLGDWADRR